MSPARALSWRDTVLGWVSRAFRSSQSPLSARRGPRDHVIILDGTMSSLVPGQETNAGLTYRLLQEVPNLSLYYEAGVQWESWSRTLDVMMGKGINRQIRRAYGFLASRYRPGDRIFLLGYSRGAFAVRSLAGIIDRVGLLRANAATERNVVQAYRLYQFFPETPAARAFSATYCHDQTQVEMVGVWDTVKALGLRLPVLWHLTEPTHAFHNHELGATVQHGFHALARDETRHAFAPLLWTCPPDYTGHMEQVWFRGSHGDVGGHLGGYEDARPLSNVPLVWMLGKLASCGIALPPDWQTRFPRNPAAPSVGTWRGWGRLFLLRGPRRIGADMSECHFDELPAPQTAPDPPHLRHGQSV